MLKRVLGIEVIEKLHIELLFRCNFRCYRCYHGERLKYGDCFTLEDLVRLISVLRLEYQLQAVTLSGGEPFLHKELENIKFIFLKIFMKKLIIALGTISPQKISYLKEVLRDLKIKSVITSVEVKSEVSDQPITSGETKKGSIKRAKNALKEIKNADFALGIEVGYHKYLQNKYEIFCWATIIDNHGHKISVQSHKFLLPKYHQDILNKGKYLGNNLDGYSKKVKDFIEAYIDNIIRHRKSFIISALKDVLVRYLKKEDF